MTGPSDEQFRAIGFSAEARKHPRDDLALSMFAAFNGATIDQMPAGFEYFPNEATARAWGRVAEAARRFIENET